MQHLCYVCIPPPQKLAVNFSMCIIIYYKKRVLLSGIHCLLCAIWFICCLNFLLRPILLIFLSPSSSLQCFRYVLFEKDSNINSLFQHTFCHRQALSQIAIFSGIGGFLYISLLTIVEARFTFLWALIHATRLW